MEKKAVERRMYEKKAQKIVERLAEETVTGEMLKSLTKYIEPYHYEEIVEERFLAKQCGYPICSNELENIPKQKYHVSMKVNKVYDITDRKRFCSGHCYKASKYFSTQIPTVPVWSREIEIDTSTIQLLNKTSAVAAIATSVIQSDSNGEIISKSNLYSNELETELKQIEQEWQKKLSLVEKVGKKLVIKKKPEVDEEDEKDKEAPKDEPIFKAYKINEKPEDVIPRVVDELQSEIHNEPQTLQKTSKYETNEYLLEKIFGTDFQQKFETKEKANLIEYIVKRVANLLSYEAKGYIKNENGELYQIQNERKQNELNEKMEKYFDQQVTVMDRLAQGIDDEQEQRKRPMPDFIKLKEEAKQQQLLIKECFFNIKEKVVDTDLHQSENDYVSLPPIDSKAQRTIREKIFFEKFIKNLEHLFKFNSFSYTQLSHEVKDHFKSFVSLLK